MDMDMGMARNGLRPMRPALAIFMPGHERQPNRAGGRL